jgi:hypothetical protein
VQQRVRHTGLGQQVQGTVEGMTFSKSAKIKFHAGVIEGHRESRGIEVDPVPPCGIAGLTNGLG